MPAVAAILVAGAAVLVAVVALLLVAAFVLALPLVEIALLLVVGHDALLSKTRQRGPRRAVAGGPAAERSGRVPVLAAQRVGVCDMGKGLVLWMLGVPGVVVILLLV